MCKKLRYWYKSLHNNGTVGMGMGPQFKVTEANKLLQSYQKL